VDVDAVFGDVEAVVVGSAVDVAGFDAAAGHPEGKDAAMVVAAVAIGFVDALCIGRTAEFPAPDDEGVFE